MKRASQRGVTLIETLVALVIFAIVIAGAFGLARSAEQILAQSARRQTLVDDAVASAFLRTQLSAVAPVVDHLENSVPILRFDGAANVLEFVSSAPSEAETPCLQLTRITLADGAIVLERAPLDRPDAVERRRLGAYAGDASFRYGAAAGGGVRFTSEWRNRSSLPAIIVLAGRDANGAPAAPIIAVRPKLSAKY